jgi:hypothetical protein
MIGDIMMSCNNIKACYYAGKDASNVKNCCSTEPEVCKYATENNHPANCHDVSTVNCERMCSCGIFMMLVTLT